jgi:hypothetical protein
VIDTTERGREIIQRPISHLVLLAISPSLVPSSLYEMFQELSMPLCFAGPTAGPVDEKDLTECRIG